MRAEGLIAIVATLLAPCVQATAPGAIKLDNYTFDKLLALPGTSVLVKFDKSYAYGEKEDEFKELCKLAYSVPGFFVAEVPVSEYGDNQNEDLADRLTLKKDDFPAFLLFSDSNKKGSRYTGSVTAADISAWLRRNQIRMPAVGTIEELDNLAKKFMTGGFADTEIAAAKTLAEGTYSTDRKGSMYVKIMQKIKEKGEAYVDSETKRVTKILEGKVTPEKSAEMNDKLKVLAMFGSKDEL